MPLSKIVQDSVNGGVAGTGPAFSVYMSANQTPSNNTFTKCPLDTEDYDTASCFNTSTNRFTPNVAGYYQINATVTCYSSNTSLVAGYTFIYKNGTTIVGAAYVINVPYSLILQPAASCVVYLNGTTDYIELYGQANASGSSQIFAGGNQQYTVMSGSLVRAA